LACPGEPACASGWIAARELAAEFARKLPPSDGTVHISGCAKGCAHPGPAALTVVGSERGCGIVQHGSPGSVPRRYVDCADIASEVVRLGAGATSSVRSLYHPSSGLPEFGTQSRPKSDISDLGWEREPTEFAG